MVALQFISCAKKNTRVWNTKLVTSRSSPIWRLTFWALTLLRNKAEDCRPQVCLNILDWGVRMKCLYWHTALVKWRALFLIWTYWKIMRLKGTHVWNHWDVQCAGQSGFHLTCTSGSYYGGHLPLVYLISQCSQRLVLVARCIIPNERHIMTGQKIRAVINVVHGLNDGRRVEPSLRVGGRRRGSEWSKQPQSKFFSRCWGY